MKYAREKETQQERDKRKAPKVASHACTTCSGSFRKDRAKCPHCGSWNVPGVDTTGETQTVLLSQVKAEDMTYLKTGPWDKMFSMEGGIAETSVTLLGGSPGGGKSTISLQIADKLAELKLKEVLYLGMEQVAKEIRVTAERIKLRNLHLIRVFPMGCTEDLASVVARYNPCALFLDSIAGMTDSPEVAVETCQALKEQFAGPMNIPCIVVDHINKDEGFAGLKKLEHAVDTTIMLAKTSDVTDDPIRIMTTTKNRFGPQAQMFLEMTKTGLIEFIPPEDDEDDE